MKRKPWLVIAGVMVAALSLALFAAACGDDGNDGAEPTATQPAETAEPTAPAEATATPADGGEATTVDVELTEFTVGPSVDTVPAGDVTFNVSNVGAIVHNFRVIKSDEAPDALPTTDEDVVDESAVDVVASSAADIETGSSEEVTATLEAGNYVLICNIATHYAAGMNVGFTVE